MDTISLYKLRIDALMDILFGAGVSNPQTIIEQLNYLLFLRALSIKDDEAELLGITDESEKIFTGDLAKYRWQNLLALNAEELFKTLESSFDVLQKNSKNPTVKLLFRNAHVKIFDKPTLRRVLHEIEEFAKELDKIAHDGNKDVFGDMYEYLLSKLSSAGTNGQFRTPRHIIDFMVRVVAPEKNETILDPACGTAGFLVAAYRYLAQEYTSDKMKKAGSSRAMDKLTSNEKNFLFNHMFTGFDSDEDMIKFGMMNLHLHGLTKSRLLRQNSLTDTTGIKDKFDVILANPPFAGKIDEESVSEDIRMGTKATELLFLRFMMDHLSTKGKLAVIVPEGVVFNTSKAHTKIRQMLVEKGLWAVISLPSGVFNPYAGVKTSLLFIDMAIAEKAKELLFIKIKNDGYDLGAQRRLIESNDLPDAFEILNEWKSGSKSKSQLVTYVEKTKLTEANGYSLNGDSYRISTQSNTKWQIVKLGEVCEIGSSKRVFESEWKTKGVPFYRAREIVKLAKNGSVENELFISNEMFEEYSKKYGSPREGDLMVTGVGTLGICYLVKKDDKFYFKDGNIIWFKNFDKRVDSRFIKCMFESDFIMDQIKASATGGTVGTYTITNANNTLMPLPPLKIQMEIVSALAKYENQIKKKEEEIRQVKEDIKKTIAQIWSA